MKAASVYEENDIRITEGPTPEPGPGEVLVKVKESGVCATDVKILGGTGLPGKLPIDRGRGAQIPIYQWLTSNFGTYFLQCLFACGRKKR